MNKSNCRISVSGSLAATAIQYNFLLFSIKRIKPGVPKGGKLLNAGVQTSVAQPLKSPADVTNFVRFTSVFLYWHVSLPEAWLCFRLNHLQNAVNSYTEALKVDPFFIEAYIGRGNTLMDFSHNTATHLGR